jgi:GTP-binding protein
MTAPPPDDSNRVIDATYVAGATRAAQLPPPALAEVAFAGRSNVGKSSLMNAMMQRRNLVRTSGTPGCTRQINVFKASMADGLALHLVDLPGYGYARLSKAEKSTWGAMIEGYLSERVTLRAVVLLVDVRRGPESDDEELLQFMAETRGAEGEGPKRSASLPEVQRVVVATKLDKLPASKRKPALMALKKSTGLPVIGFSAVTGDGRAELWGRLRKAIA